jgi:hypothetical protein
MSKLQDKIRHHQRILITGERAKDILSVCTHVLDHYQKPYDVISADQDRIERGPIVFITANDDFNAYHPHIALVDQITNLTKEAFEKLANEIPKAGTLVYNATNPLAKAICSTPRADVYREEYNESSVNAAASALLRRIGISEKHFADAR